MIILGILFLVGLLFILGLPVAYIVERIKYRNFKKASKKGNVELAEWYYDTLTNHGKMKPSKRRNKLHSILEKAYQNEEKRGNK